MVSGTKKHEILTISSLNISQSCFIVSWKLTTLDSSSPYLTSIWWAQYIWIISILLMKSAVSVPNWHKSNIQNRCYKKNDPHKIRSFKGYMHTHTFRGSDRKSIVGQRIHFIAWTTLLNGIQISENRFYRPLQEKKHFEEAVRCDPCHLLKTWNFIVYYSHLIFSLHLLMPHPRHVIISHVCFLS